MLLNVINQIKIKAKIYESSNSTVYRGVRNSDQCPIILKILKQDYPTPLELSRYRQEYEITRNLNIAGVIQTYGLEKYQNKLVILFEDFGGESLRILMANRQFSLTEFFNIAIQTSQILGQIHQQHIIHKDINPANIVFNPDTGQIKLIDFGISTVLQLENPTLKNPNILEGTLPYISPEQTGRMNRALDYRTDFYSLGATFYELLTKQRPFSATDPLEMVHCHLAKQPIPVHELNPKIPPIVSHIVMKLLAKNAEERYQSAYGLAADLENCWRQLQINGNITAFPLAQQDITQRLQLSQKIYGREAEIQELLAAFERTSQGNCEIMLVSGYSGVGKSALVQELYKAITQQRGYFITGKFEEYQRNIPYNAIIKAFQELAKQILTESETQLNQWREKLLSAFGANGQVITNVIPEIELIVGKQPAIPTLSPAAAENRFNLVLQNFLQVFTQATHPLVLFLDDLQWADSASLKLLQQNLTAPNSGYFFLVGAYRDNELNPTHPLNITLEKLQKEAVTINQINLLPLDLSQLQQLIADSLQSHPNLVSELAELVQIKTQGNPFFVNEFLKSLYIEELLYFEEKTRTWQWDISQIQAKSYTDNVIDLMVSKIHQLSESTQSILQLAAAIGNRFDLQTLAIANQTSLSQTALALQEALIAQLIFPLYDGYPVAFLFKTNIDEIDGWFSTQASEVIYQFTHDRIQQAAYSLIPLAQRPVLHHHIGKFLLENTPNNQLDSCIFQLVNQLNLGITHTVQPVERLQLASLNLMAGKKAKSAAAYESAFTYFITGIELLGKNSWQTEYEVSLELYVLATETAYLVADFPRMKQLAALAVLKTKTLLEKVPIYDIEIRAHIAQNQLSVAINKALEVLKMLGVKFPKNPSQLNSILGMIRTKIALFRKPIESLANLPEMTDPLQLARMQILSTLSTAAYLGMPELYPLIVFQQFQLLVKYGNCAEAAFIYATYGLILCGILDDLESGYKFGLLALQILERFNAKEWESKTFFIVTTYITHWREMAAGADKLREAYLRGLETGDFEFAAFAAHQYCFRLFALGEELSKVKAEMAAYSQEIKRLKQKTAYNYQQIYYQLIFNLTEESDDLVSSVYDAEKMLPIHLAAGDGMALYNFYCSQMMRNYLYQNYAQALENARESEKYLGVVAGSVYVPIFYLYHSLIHLAVIAELPKNEQKKCLDRVVANQKKLKKWADYNPKNYLPKFYLVEAEKCRVLKESNKAIDLYDLAIQQAKQNHYLHEEALANELAAKFYLYCGKDAVASAYFTNARACYLYWGATAKVRDLQTRYPHLFLRQNDKEEVSPVEPETSSSSTQNRLDLASIFKASQAISDEIQMASLLNKIIKILTENAGAEAGYLLLYQGNKLIIEAVNYIECVNYIPRQAKENLPESLINYVARTQSTVVLDNAVEAGEFMQDSCITRRQIKSLLCMPILNQAKLIGILYLENNLATAVFTPARLKVLHLLTSQAAISLENARLYAEKEQYAQTLEQKVAARTAELEKANQELQRIATLDGLTKVANRRRFDEYLAQEWQRATREKQPLALILCDVDYFKRYNDYYGHQGGDDCLRQVALAMSRAVKRPADLLARYGGEEFVVILPNTEIEGAASVAQAIREEMQQLKMPHAQSDVSEYVSLSLGVSSVNPSQNLAPETLIATADEALYEAKKQGRNRFIIKNVEP